MLEDTTPAEVTQPATPVVAAPATPAQTSPDTDYKAESEKLQAKYEAAQKDIQKFRVREEQVKTAEAAAERERLEKAPLEEKLRGYEKELEKANARATAAEQARTSAERRSALAGRVIDTDAALKLLGDEFVQDDGTVNADAFLEKYPFLKVTADAPARASTPPANPRGAGTPGALTPEAINAMSPKEYAERRSEIMAALSTGTIRR